MDKYSYFNIFYDHPFEKEKASELSPQFFCCVLQLKSEGFQCAYMYTVYRLFFPATKYYVLVFISSLIETILSVLFSMVFPLTVRFSLLLSSVILLFEAPDITESGLSDSIVMWTFGQFLNNRPLPDSELIDGNVV